MENDLKAPSIGKDGKMATDHLAAVALGVAYI